MTAEKSLPAPAAGPRQQPAPAHITPAAASTTAGAFPPESCRLFDAHCHLDFMANASEVAADARRRGLAIFATTVDANGTSALANVARDHDNVIVGAGAHPWWVADGRMGAADVAAAARAVAHGMPAGEVGIDLSPNHVPDGSYDAQEQAFCAICMAAAEASRASGRPTPLSIHSVRAATACLDILEDTGCLEACRPVFHWFSGTSDELARAVRAGCHFSVNEMMLETRRGREYARQVPLERLLTETDLPPKEGAPFSAEKICASLERTLSRLADIRRLDRDELAEAVMANARKLFSA